MKNVCVVYSGGLYGTFIEWCLNYFTDKNFPPQLPFTVNGSSHLYPGNLLRDMSQARQYINFRLDKPIVRVHLVTSAQSTESTINDLKHLYDNFHQLIFLYTEENTSIWGLNNKCDKIYKGFFVQDSIELKKVDTWITQGLAPWNTDLQNAETWQLREFLSSVFIQGYLSESSTELIDIFKNLFPKIIFVSIRDLRDSFEKTIIQLIDQLGLKLERDDFERIYQNWIELQYHRHKDDLIKTIVDNAINEIYYDWSEEKLTIVDEAAIQYFLRKRGIELRCWKLNGFPTDTTELRNYFDNVAS